MRCKKIQELILTDYIDGQMEEKQKAPIEKHLDGCPECKEFYASAKKVSTDLFVNADRANPPEFVWQRLRDTILAERQKKPEYVFHIPRPVFALATAMTLFLIVGTIIGLRVNEWQASNAEKDRQAQYLDYQEEVGFGTSIEEYFLEI